MGKEKLLITSFFAANILDAALTYYALHYKQGFSEIGLLGARVVESDNLDTAIIVKLGVIALMIGSYALAKSNNIVTFGRSYEKAIKIGSVIVWGWVALNTAQILIS